MDLEFAGKVIAVTGASRGVGLMIAERLAAEGAAVAIAARSAQELAQAHATIEGHGGRCLAYACDLSVPGEAAAFIAAVTEIFGRLDGLVCNAAMASGQMTGREAWQGELALNLGHAVEALEAALPVLASPGSVVLVAPKSRDDWALATCRGGLEAVIRHFVGKASGRINLIGKDAEGLADSVAFLLSVRAAAIDGTVLGA